MRKIDVVFLCRDIVIFSCVEEFLGFMDLLKMNEENEDDLDK